MKEITDWIGEIRRILDMIIRRKIAYAEITLTVKGGRVVFIDYRGPIRSGDMSDLIRREDAIEAIQQRADKIDSVYSAFWEGLIIAQDIVKNIQSAEPERVSMVWKPADGRPAYEKGICSCGYVLSVLQRDFVYCPMCGCRLEWE